MQPVARAERARPGGRRRRVGAWAGGLVAAALLAGTAGAATILGTPRGDVLRGTARADFLDGRGGRDRVLARGGDDRVRAQDGLRDAIACGPGRDLVNADALDAVAADCETVARRISRDRYRDGAGQHESQVEPDTFAFGSTVVSVFQSGRTVEGGASNNDFATSLDGGRTWRTGGLPGLTRNSVPPGRYDRASDPVVAYEARHGTWLATSLVFGAGTGGAIVVSRSPDGIVWGPPVTVTASSAAELQLDKQWLACDSSAASRFFGSCYMVYSDLRTRRMSLQTSRDGGLTWSAPIGSPDNAGRRSILGRFNPGPQPVVRPDGVLVIPYYDEDRIAAVRSLDGGATLTTGTAVAPTHFELHGLLRDPPLPSAEVGADGTVYVVWPDCSGRRFCIVVDLVLSKSADGVSWTQPTRIPGGGPRNVIPGLAVDPTGTGTSTRLALAYYAVTARSLDAFFTSSPDAGATWTAPRRLSAQRMPLAWLPATTQGAMVADYISTSFVNGNAVPVFAIASARAARLDQAMFAAVLPVPR
jgi:hypothetical protein